MGRFRVLLISAVGLGAMVAACSSTPTVDAGTDVQSPTDTAEGGTPMDVQGTDATDVTMGDTVVTPDAPVGNMSFQATLTGSQETPAVTTTATGTATITVNTTTNMLTYSVTHTLAGVTMAHIHTGEPGVAGGVTIALTGTGLTITGTAPITAPQLADLAAGRMYVNLHSAANPGGELRGQILATTQRLFIATLTGANEVPPVTTTATGYLALILDSAAVAPAANARYVGSFTGLTATMAHIHTGAMGANGGVLTPLTITGMTLAGTATLDATAQTALAASGLYVNIHTAANAGGEIRGQLRTP